MSCKRCESDKLKDFSAKIAIHSPGQEGLNKPHVFLFPKLMACLDCGFTEFVIPNDQREKLQALSSGREGSLVRILPEVW